jgi:hypothetical protein
VGGDHTRAEGRRRQQGDEPKSSHFHRATVSSVSVIVWVSSSL